MVNFTYFTQLEGKTISRVEVLTETGHAPYTGVVLHCDDGVQIDINASVLGLEKDSNERDYNEGYEDGYKNGKNDGYGEGQLDKIYEIIEAIKPS